MTSYSRNRILTGLDEYNSSTPQGNQFFTVNLSTGDTAWNPEGDNFEGPGEVTYARYVRQGGTLYASLSLPDSI
ncbi:hypothetical protein ACFW2V_12605 [Streptomyces sp. NPDC058947]|uniref:hypothetical protein n=1 Tax=Streptomyces sp. NPDC058947 TaxID=3346675 RepID=UPI0036C57960